MKTVGNGTFEVTLPEKSKPDLAALVKAVGKKFTVEQADLTLVGDVTTDDKGTWLTARGSGAKLKLANQETKGDAVPPDVLGELNAKVKEGKTTFKVSGELKTETDKDKSETAIVRLVKATVEEKKAEEKK